MRTRTGKVWAAFVAMLLASGVWLSPTSSRADNKILGRINFVAAGKVEKSAGVWVDGQYVGHISELKGDKKVLLMPGSHSIAVRQSGYKDWTGDVVVQPGQDVNLTIRLERNPEAAFPSVTAEVKLEVDPNRAAVFVDGHFAGYAHQFGGMGRAMLVAPGRHQIKIALVGYRDFTTEVTLQPHQKFTLKTSLIPGSVQQADPSVKKKP
ncbi:MAG: PEGA domain-containing protein [Candidatus Acidiferrales bacterium]